MLLARDAKDIDMNATLCNCGLLHKNNSARAPQIHHLTLVRMLLAKDAKNMDTSVMQCNCGLLCCWKYIDMQVVKDGPHLEVQTPWVDLLLGCNCRAVVALALPVEALIPSVLKGNCM